MNADTILHKVIGVISITSLPDEHYEAYCELAERALAAVKDPDKHYDHCALVARLMLTVGLWHKNKEQGSQPLFSLN